MSGRSRHLIFNPVEVNIHPALTSYPEQHWCTLLSESITKSCTCMLVNLQSLEA